MGRKKIQISRITDERNRQVTFNKRKFGVMKKAYELSVLCDCEIALIIFSSSNKLYQYASTDMDKVLLKYTEYNEPHESLTNKNIIEKENKNGIMSPDSPEQETDYTLTPRTEAKYNKIDEEFQTMMRNQMAGGGVVTARNMTNPNYTLPVSVPVAGSYGDAMLQASPQMSHTNISPRPSSSETDSAHHLSHKQESPGNQNGRASHLRVVIPTTGVAQNMSTTDDIGYSDRHGQSLNTPVVTLQTPIPGLAGYSTFGPQDFSMSSSDVIGLPTWTTHQGLVSHAGLPHLTVSNSVSPPATSPVSIKVKSEPQSPPRDLSGSGGGGGGGGGGGNNNNGGLTNHQQNSNGSNGSSNGHISTSNALTISGMNNAVAAAAVIAGGGGGGGGAGGGGTVLGGASLTGEQAANLSVLNHPQQHLVMAGSRPSSTGHITPTPVIDKYEGYPYRSQLGPNPRYWNFADFIIFNTGATGGGGGGGSNGANTPTNLPSPTTHQQQQLTDYDGPNQPLKRPRISGGWAT